MTETGSGQDAGHVGAALRRARHGEGLGAEEAAARSGLEPPVVLTLEQGDPVEWAADARLLAALRIYARMLGLDPEPLVTTAWRRSRERGEPASGPPVRPLLPPGHERRVRQRRRRWLAVAVVVPVLLASSAAVLALGLADEPADSAAELGETTGADEQAPGEPEGEEGSDGSGGEDGAAAEAASDGLPGRPPAETPVQVLNALDDEQATAEVADHLESLGYEVVLIDRTRQVWDETATYYEPGWETEADSLQARDGRFAVAGPNDVFVDEAGLHVVVGRDWGEQP